MNNLSRFSFAALAAVMVWGCSSTENAPANNKIEVDELVFAQNPEPVKGKLDVYTSMARTVKYNVDVTSQEMNKKIFSTEPNSNPKDIIQNALNVKAGSDNPLYDSIRILDYAVLYAMTTLSDNRAYIDSNLYAKSSQNLALAAIKSHKDALFAEKKVKEVRRLIDKEQKKLRDLNAKLERVGKLSPAELNYKKGLEVALLKLNELQGALAYNMVEYSHLIKGEAKDLKLEGRMFYELDDFDKKLTVKAFQSSAFRNRNEFAIAKEMGKSYSYVEVERNLIKKYPEIERMNINGYDVESPVYAEGLEKRAYEIAMTLADRVNSYKFNKKEDQKKPLRIKAFDELGIAIFTQVELAYNLVRLSEIDYGIISKQIVDLKKEIKEMDHSSYKLTSDAKVMLLNKKIKLLEMETKQSQILGEKAIAIKAIYFYAGFSPFNRTILKNEIKDIVPVLKAAFNKDMIEMLAAVPEQEKAEETHDRNWAKKENWLEELLEGKKKPAPKPITVAVHDDEPDDIYAPYTNKAFNNKKIMQLGSYTKRENADTEWKMLQELYPEFKNYTPEVIRARVDGVIMFRLVLRSEQGGFLALCNKLRADRVQCLLK